MVNVDLMNEWWKRQKKKKVILWMEDVLVGETTTN
jgi:hypothetical protein